MSPTVYPGLLFGDEFYSATEFVRHSADVFDHAKKQPVTISRNNEMFALLKREDAASLVKAVSGLRAAIQIVLAALNASNGIDVSSEFNWLKAFDREDLITFVKEVLSATQTVVVANRASAATDDWTPVEDLIHEWHESALVNISGVLEEAKSSPADEAEIPNPAQTPTSVPAGNE